MKHRVGYLLLPLLFFVTSLRSQERNSVVAEVLGSIGEFSSSRLFYMNGDDNIYGEARIGWKFNKYCEANVALGYQERSYIYFAQTSDGSLRPLFMDRYYIPAGINFRVMLSEFFHEKLKIWKKEGRWDVYNQIGIAKLYGKDIRDPNEEAYRQQGAYVPFYLHPYIEPYGKIYLTYLIGIRYNTSEHVGVFLEGGEGMITTLQIGLSASF